MTSDTQPAGGIATLGKVLEWLASPPNDDPAEDLLQLRQHLDWIREFPPAPAQVHKLLELIYERMSATSKSVIPKLFAVRLPLATATRRHARSLQDVLELIARAYVDAAENSGDRLIAGLRRPDDLLVWRAVHSLGRHLFISDLISAPPSPGIWQQLHAAMKLALRLGVADQTPAGTDCSVQVLYQRSLLLGCGHPSAFTAQEWSNIERYVARNAHLVIFFDQPRTERARSHFWFNPAEDTCPIAVARRPPGEAPGLVHFSCEALLALLERERQQLVDGGRPGSVGLADDLPIRLARTLMLRLGNVWGDPRKRHFQRRRQSYRARLCFGFDGIWEMLRGKRTDEASPSEWMVTNESPDGYSAMHVSGKPQKVQNGDLVGLRSESMVEWQICVVRWALSENPEHLEIGLQVVSPSALPATLAGPGQAQGARQPALLMPALPPFRPTLSLATQPGLLMETSGALVLMVETTKVEIREVRVVRVQEQTPDADLFAIEPDRPASR